MPADKPKQSASIKTVIASKEELNTALYIIQRNNYTHSLDWIDELLSDLLVQMDMAGSFEVEIEAKNI